MPQLAMRQQIAMGQFALTRQLLMGGQQQQQAAVGSQQQQPAQKPTKVTKVRRTRQSRNPQLSVARRNERERNRVKMVNNGFALLRDHLPIEYLQQTGGSQQHQGYESAESETPDLGPLSAKSPGSQSSKAKKFSKVETLRAAIQHIKMLQELMRSADPNFESINIQQQQQQLKQEEGDPSSVIGYDDIDSGPLSCGDGPLSCGSSSSLTSSSLAGVPQQSQQRQSAPVYARDQLAANPEQFVKLEPFVSAGHIQFQPQQQQQIVQPASPLDSASTTIQTTPVSQHQHLSHYSQAPAMMTQVQHQQTIASSETATSEHTHLWIQQHQSSFMEQQQQQQQQQQQYTTNQDQWSPYQQQYVHQQELSPTTLTNGNMHYQQQQIQFASQQQQQLDSPPAGHWFAPSPPNSTIQQQVANESVNFAGHHQISLYSQ